MLSTSVRSRVLRSMGAAYLTLGVHAAAFAERANIPKDTGMFKDDVKFNGALDTLNWTMMAIPAVPCIFLMVYSGVKLKDQEYGPAAASGLGSIVCGIAAFLAGTIMA